MALVILVPLTSLAVASISFWLVVPYLLLMGAILFAPSRQPGDPASTPYSPLRAAWKRARQQARARVAADLAHRDSEPASAPLAASTSELAPDAEETAESRPTKSRRGRGRVKVVRPTDEPASGATFVRVGPGKFVRMEGQSASAEGDVLIPHMGELGAPAASSDSPAEPGATLPESPQTHIHEQGQRAAYEDAEREASAEQTRWAAEASADVLGNPTPPAAPEGVPETAAADDLKARDFGERAEADARTVQQVSETEEQGEPGSAEVRQNGWDLDDDCNAWRENVEAGAERGAEEATSEGQAPLDLDTDGNSIAAPDRGTDASAFPDEPSREWSDRGSAQHGRSGGVAAGNVFRADRFGRPARGARSRSQRAAGRVRALARAYLSRAPP
jgi:hypothetical protein